MLSTSPSLLDQIRGEARPAAWDRFLHIYTPLLGVWAFRLGFRGADAEDFVQDVLAHLIVKLPEFSYDPMRRFRGWLWRVVTNVAHERARKREIPIAGDGYREIVDARSDNPADVIEEQEYIDFVVQRALECMRSDFEDKTWRAFWEFVVCGRTAANVGRELDMTENAVYLARIRVLKRLREQLAGLVE